MISSGSSRNGCHVHRAFVMMLAVLASGCAWQKPKEKAEPWHGSEAQAVLDMPAAQAVSAVRQALTLPPLSLDVESVNEGTVYTGWKDYPGDIHIVRRWHERTRFRISVTPDFSNPAGKSRLSIEDQSQERGAENQPWYNAPNTGRPERSAQVLTQVQKQIQTRP